MITEQAKKPKAPFAQVDRSRSTLKISVQIQEIARHHRFDWDNPQGVIAKIYEELAEFIAADARSSRREQCLYEELGDVLFTAISLARHYSIDPELALRNANHKFETRFQKMMGILTKNGTNIDCASRAQLEQAWHDAKKEEKQAP